MHANFRFQIAHLRLSGTSPEFPAQILAASRVTRVVLEARGVTNRVKKQGVTFRCFRISLQQADETRQSKRTFRFIPMQGSEDADASRVAASFGPHINVPW